MTGFLRATTMNMWGWGIS